MMSLGHHYQIPAESYGNGVYNLKLVIDFSGVSNYLEGLVTEYKESYEKAKEKKKPPRAMFEQILSRYRDTLELLNVQDWSDKDSLKNVIATLSEFSELDEHRKVMRSLFYTEITLGDIIEGMIRRKKTAVVFDSRQIAEAKDVVAIEKKHIDGHRWLFDVVTIKESGLSTFKEDLQRITPIKEGMKIIKERRQFSSRYTFRPYPLATELWLRDSASMTVPSDLKSFLQSAIRYIFHISIL